MVGHICENDKPAVKECRGIGTVKTEACRTVKISFATKKAAAAGYNSQSFMRTAPDQRIQIRARESRQIRRGERVQETVPSYVEGEDEEQA